MALGANSYGDVDEVAALVPKYANPETLFDETTRPTRKQLETNIDQISAMTNGILSHMGFTIPISDDDAKDLLDGFVNMTASHVVEYINGTGRFGPRDKTSKGRGVYSILIGEIKDFLEDIASGLEGLGADRTRNFTSGIAFRDTDNSGDDTFPIFQREAFGQSWTDWDAD